jgi:hypothetical protein
LWFALQIKQKNNNNYLEKPVLICPQADPSMAKPKNSGIDPVGAVIKAALTPTPKGVLKQREREDRVDYVLSKYDLRKLSAAKVLKHAQREGISIDQIEKRIARPLAKLRDEDEGKYRKAARKFKGDSSAGVWLILLIGIFLWFWLSR